MTKPHKGTINNYKIVTWQFLDGEYMVIIGEWNGGRIRTSPVVMLSAYEVETENSIYSLGKELVDE